MLGWKIARHVSAMLATILLGGLLSVTLVRLAPGFGADEELLDPHLNADSVRALRQSRDQQQNIFRFYLHSMQRALHGDLGTSMSLGQPVTKLLRERAPLTVRLVAIGLLLSWAVAMALALSAAWLRVSAYDAVTTLVSGTFLCIPAAVLALLSVLWNVPGSLAIGLIVFPRVYRYARNLLAKAYSLPHLITARAKGLSEMRILFWHVVPVVGPQLLAVAGVSVSVAIGAAIPVEALCGLAGLGQLAWQAALGRDLPIIGTEGGSIVGSQEDPKMAPVTASTAAEWTAQSFRYMRDRREPWLFASSVWTIADLAAGAFDSRFEAQALFKADGTRSSVVHALQALG